MYKLVRRFALLPIALVFGLATALAINFPEAGASESSSPAGSHVVSAKSLSPIELDPSQEARCKRTTPADRIDYKNCSWAKRLVALMSAEPRDRAWADKMESDLRKWVESLASEGFILRNVECRSSWCILEVGSTQGGILEMNLRDADKRKLFEPIAENLFAPDIDDQNTQDQVIFYKRFCNSTRELIDHNGHLVPNFYTVDKGC